MPTAHREALFALKDPSYRDFQCKLMPTVPSETVIGVRTPALRAFAQQFACMPEARAFLEDLPHTYYEENNLHAFLIERIGGLDDTLSALDRFLPYVDNWATCDMMRPKIFQKHPEALLKKIHEWLASGHTYTVRFAIGMLLSYYLDVYFRPEHLALAADIQSDEYYVNMMVAWYFATALAKQYDAALPYFEARRLAPWTHNKAIQKAIESFRVLDEHKVCLRALKIGRRLA